MAREDRNSSTQIMIAEDDESPTNAFFSRNRCCFNFPCFSSSQTAYSSSDIDRRWWWSSPIRTFKKIREWSEIVAGPRWKTFIRRFNRHPRSRHQVPGGGGGGKFQYDPLSYALNFDEGPGGQNGDFEEEYDHFPDFTSRFASIPLSAKSSMDLSNGAPAG